MVELETTESHDADWHRRNAAAEVARYSPGDHRFLEDLAVMAPWDLDAAPTTIREYSWAWLRALAEREFVGVQIARFASRDTYEVSVFRSHEGIVDVTLTTSALVQAPDPAALLETTIRSAARECRAIALDRLLSRLDQAELAALLVERITDPVAAATLLVERITDGVVAEGAMLALAGRVERIG